WMPSRVPTSRTVIGVDGSVTCRPRDASTAGSWFGAAMQKCRHGLVVLVGCVADRLRLGAQRERLVRGELEGLVEDGFAQRQRRAVPATQLRGPVDRAGQQVLSRYDAIGHANLERLISLHPTCRKDQLFGSR